MDSSRLRSMNPRAAAARYGITVEFADLGDWGAATLIAEYDPNVPAIRINERAIERYCRTAAALAGCGKTRGVRIGPECFVETRSDEMGALGFARCTRATPQRCDRRATKLSAEQAGSRRRREFFRNLLGRCDVGPFVDLAIAHELYHHREATGEIARLATHLQREEAAHAFARANVTVDAVLDAFLKAAL